MTTIIRALPRTRLRTIVRPTDASVSSSSWSERTGCRLTSVTMSTGRRGVAPGRAAGRDLGDQHARDPAVGGRVAADFLKNRAAKLETLITLF
jgi:hypothetical protein